MLAIAGIVTWVSYAGFVYGISQLKSQNYSLKDLCWPGVFTLGSPPPDPPSGPTAPGGAGKTGGSAPSPCNAAQLAQGMTNDINGNCMAKATGTYKCVNGDGDVVMVSGKKCPQGYTHPSKWAGIF
jgi:hypothetical protein